MFTNLAILGASHCTNYPWWTINYVPLLSSSNDPEIVCRSTNLLQIQKLFIVFSYHVNVPAVFSHTFPMLPIFPMAYNTKFRTFFCPICFFCFLCPLFSTLSISMYHFICYLFPIDICSLWIFGHLTHHPNPCAPKLILSRKPKWTKTTWPMPRRQGMGFHHEKWRKGEID